MEKNRKELRDFSILILAIVAIELIRNIITLCVNGLPKLSDLPEGTSEGVAQATAIITVALGFVVFIPQIYVGLKGLKIANGANGGKAHITWALILTVFATLSTISALSALGKGVNLDKVLDLVAPALDLLVFAFYHVYARKVAGAK